jgi:integrase
MSVEKTPEGRWRARWREPGERNARSRVFARKADAIAFERAMLTDLARGTYQPPRRSTITVAQMADEWLDTARNLRPASLETYRRDLDRYILPALGRRQLAALRAEHIDRYLASLTLAPSSVARHYRTIRRMCVVAVERGHLNANPCDPVKPPRVEHDEMRFLTTTEVDRLADVITVRYRAWVLVAAWGGLRWSELAGLRPVNVDGPRVMVVEQILRGPGGWYRQAPKTRAGRRTVTLPSEPAAVLAEHLGRWSTEDLVFPNQHGNPIGPSFRGNVWRRATVKAGLEGVRPHDLRHTAVALAIAAGAHPKAVQARLGHASISVTMDRYGHLFEDADADVAALLDRLTTPNVGG